MRTPLAVILSLALALALTLCACGTSPTQTAAHDVAWQEQYDLGVRYLSEGNYEEAIIAFSAAIEIDPKRAEAYIGRGDAYVLSGEADENLAAAQADYERAIELDQTLQEAYLGLANIYIRRRDFSTAKATIERAPEWQDNQEMQALYREVQIEINTQREYDSNGNLIKETTLDEGGNPTGYIQYSYGENNILLVEKHYDAQNLLKYMLEYQKGLRKKATWYNQEQVSSTIYYDNNGEEERREFFDTQGFLLQIDHLKSGVVKWREQFFKDPPDARGWEYLLDEEQELTKLFQSPELLTLAETQTAYIENGNDFFFEGYDYLNGYEATLPHIEHPLRDIQLGDSLDTVLTKIGVPTQGVDYIRQNEFRNIALNYGRDPDGEKNEYWSLWLDTAPCAFVDGEVQNTLDIRWPDESYLVQFEFESKTMRLGQMIINEYA